MSTITSTNAYEDLGLGLRQKVEKPKDQLGQEEFLELMTTQLVNQDPLKPMEDGDFISQMAQFGTVNGITELQSSFASMASAMQSSQALQASVMVGRSVTVASEFGALAETGDLTASVNLPNSTQNTIVNISKPNGELVRTLSLGEQSAGMNDFSWDGLTEDGERAPAGNYVITAQSTNGADAESLQIFTSDTVDSVSLGGAGGFTLHLSSLGDRSMNDVFKIS